MSPTYPAPAEIAGYTVFPLSLPPLPSFPTPATHYLYLAPHQPKVPTPTASRSLFLVNVPFDSSEAHIKKLFSTQLGLPAGRIEDVQFEGQRRKLCTQDDTKHLNNATNNSKKRKRSSERSHTKALESAALPTTWDRELQLNGSTAIVLFVDRSCSEAALKAVKLLRKQKIQPTWGEGVEADLPPLGYPRYLRHHELTYPNKTQLLESVDSYMTAFANQEAARDKLRARQRQEPDEDGFIMVTRGGRTNPAKQEVARESADKQIEKRKGLEDFYRFQSREKKKAKAGELMKKFEEDKEKVRKLKEKRGRFKPE